MSDRSAPRPTIERLRRRKETHRQRSRLYRVSFVILGAIVIVLGLLLSFPGIPGPGLLLVIAGLAMLALEFDRAERLLERVLLRHERLTERAARAGPVKKLVGAVALALAAVGLVAAVVLWDLPVVPG